MRYGHALVAQIITIDPHHNADRLEVAWVNVGGLEGARVVHPPSRPPIDGPYSVPLVTGKHYHAHDIGVWLTPGATIPGWLALDLWLVGKKRAEDPFLVASMEIRGQLSYGLWCGQWYHHDNSPESQKRFVEQATRDGYEIRTDPDGHADVKWKYWNEAWTPGMDVSEELLGAE